MGAQDKLPNSSSSMQRVKVYRLNEDGEWDDQGTGHISVDYLERSEDLGLFVVDEEDNETLLAHRISSNDIYRKQEETIISWRDPGFSTELALSFQETTGCSYVWDHICSVQRNMQFNSFSNETYHNVNSELRELPPVELSSLPLILKTVVESGITDQLRVTEAILHDQGFLPKLMELFRRSEDLENIDDLHLIFKIIRGIILLNSTQIFEKIFGDDLIMDIVGCLEYDPEVPNISHRDFLKGHVVYKEVIPIKDPVVISKIHQTYRIGYLKDVILSRALDEATVATLNSVIHSNNAIVVSLLREDNDFTRELFARLKSPITSIESKKALVHFLHEFCTLSKSLQMVHQLRFFRDLANEGIFDIIADVLQSEDKKLVLTATDILILFLNQDPNILRSYLSRQDSALFGLLVKNILTDFVDDMHCQFLEILRNLLESCSPGSQRESIVEIFYEKHFGQLIDAITSSCPPNANGGQIGFRSSSTVGESMNQNHMKPEILLNICDLLCFCVSHHAYRIKCSFLLNDVIDKVLYLTRRREKYLLVAAVRFVRTLVSRSDEHLMNHVVKNNLFKPIIDVFIANGDRYNLLNSVVLELFEYIQKENLKILLSYLVDTFWDQLARFENLSSVQALKVKYEQSQEKVGTISTDGSLDQRKCIDDHALEKEEYFNGDSDEEDMASTRTPDTYSGLSRPCVLANGSSSTFPSSRPPPRKMDDKYAGDDGVVQFRLKRKLAPKEEPEPKRLQWNPKVLKPIEGVCVALCSPLSQTVLPSKKVITSKFNIGQLDADKSTEKDVQDKGSISSLDENRDAKVENYTTDKEAVFPGSCLSDSADIKPRGDECPLLPTNSSPEMAVNGS